jgi:hypothetical protein
LLPDFPVVRDETTGEFVYAELDPDGEIKTTSFRVGKADPAKEGLKKGHREKERKKGKNGTNSEGGLRGEIDKQENKGKKGRNVFNDESRLLDDEYIMSTIDDHHRRATQTTGTIRNLVIPLKWSDHTGRTLPSREDIDVLMNHAGPERRCPTGSVKDVFLENSYGKLELESTVVDWVLVPNTEAFYANGRSM